MKKEAKVTAKKKVIFPVDVQSKKQGLTHSLKTVNKQLVVANSIFGDFTPSKATTIMQDVEKRLREHSLNKHQDITLIAEQLGVLSFWWSLKRLQDVIDRMTEILVFENDIIYKNDIFIVDSTFEEHCSNVFDIVLTDSAIIHKYEKCELWIDRLDSLFELMDVQMIVWKKHRMADLFDFLSIENDKLIPNVSYFLTLESDAKRF